jgi:hypothetical protein
MYRSTLFFTPLLSRANIWPITYLSYEKDLSIYQIRICRRATRTGKKTFPDNFHSQLICRTTASYASYKRTQVQFVCKQSSRNTAQNPCTVLSIISLINFRSKMNVFNPSDAVQQVLQLL